MRDGGGELSGLGETGSEETRDLLDQSFGGQESVVLLGEFLDEFLVFIKSRSRGINAKEEDEESFSRTSLNRRPTYIRGRFVWHDRYRRHRQECKWTSLAGGHSGVCERESDSA